MKIAIFWIAIIGHGGIIAYLATTFFRAFNECKLSPECAAGKISGEFNSIVLALLISSVFTLLMYLARKNSIYDTDV